MQKKFLIILILTINLIYTHTASARWMNIDDALTEHASKENIYVYKNGDSKSTKEITIKILKESAKSEFSPFILQYNASREARKIVQAKTILNNKEYIVNLKNITDKPISSENQLFDQTNQILIPYSNLAVNAIIYLKYEINAQNSIPENYYATYFSSYYPYYTKKNISIQSELPLHIETNDPDKIFSVTQKTQKIKNKNLAVINITQTKPFIKMISDEEIPRLNPKNIPIVSISSIKDFNDYSNAIAIHYEKIKQQPLPELYKEIALAAQTKKTNLEKINTVTSLLAEKITYLADARTIKGGFIPQPLQRVVDTRLGDCKDFSMATSVILQSIGIPSKIAFVMRGEALFPFPNNLPGPGHLNHAIVKVELPEGPLWVDPTNFTSMANHIHADISNRKTLVLSVNNSTYETIPAIKNTDHRIVINETWHKLRSNELEVTGNLKFLGNSAKMFTGDKNKYSEEFIQNKLIDIVNEQNGKVLHHKIKLPDLNSRIVNDLSFNYNLTTQNSHLKTNAGGAIPLSFHHVDLFFTKKNTVSDLYVGSPRIIESYRTIKNITPIGKQSLDCQIESPWANITRAVKYDKNQVLIHQKIEVKKSWIEASELNSDEYKKLQLAIHENFNNGIAIIFEPKV